MKQILSLILCVWFCTSAWAQSGTTDFDIDENGILTGYHGPGGDVVIPGTVTAIGEYVFHGNENLTSVIIPNSVTSIGAFAFRDCYNLASIVMSESISTIEQCAFNYCTSLTSITIPNLVTSIGDFAFANCYSLLSVTIPASVTNIGEYAFAYCDVLQEITVKGSTPVSILDNVFGGVNKRNCTLNVPEGALEAYQTADVWKYFLDNSDFEIDNNGVLIHYWGQAAM